MFQAIGIETSRIVTPHVKPFVKRQKNDTADAEAICEASLRLLGRRDEPYLMAYFPTSWPRPWGPLQASMATTQGCIGPKNASTWIPRQLLA